MEPLDRRIVTEQTLLDGPAQDILVGLVNSPSSDLRVALDTATGAQQGKVFTPEQFGAVGDGVADDTAALQAAIDAAHANGGGTVVLSGRYGWAGDLLHKGAVNVRGVGTRKVLAADDEMDRGLVALASSSRYRYGQWGSGSANDNPGSVTNLVIDGAGVGGATELFRCECVDGAVVDCRIVNAANNCVELGGSQNSTFDRTLIGYAGNVAVNSLNIGGQGAGTVTFNSCYVTDAPTLLYMDADAGQFWPHDLTFDKCLFECRLGTINNLIEMGAGVNIQFKSSIFTWSVAAGNTCSDDCLVLLRQDVWPTISTQVVFDSCSFNGGNTGVTDAVRAASPGAGVGNEVRFYGRNQVTLSDYVVCSDTKSTLVAIDGATYRGSGVAWYRSINGGTLFNVLSETATPVRFRMPDGDGSLRHAQAFRRDADTQDRYSVTRDGELYWFDGSTATVRGSLVRDSATNQMRAGGTWRFGNGLMRRSASQFINSVGATVSHDASQASEFQLLFLSNGSTVTTFTITNGVEGMDLRLAVVGTGTNTITWPSNVRFAGNTAPTIANATWTIVNLTYRSGVWVENSRSVGVPSS